MGIWQSKKDENKDRMCLKPPAAVCYNMNRKDVNIWDWLNLSVKRMKK